MRFSWAVPLQRSRRPNAIFRRDRDGDSDAETYGIHDRAGRQSQPDTLGHTYIHYNYGHLSIMYIQLLRSTACIITRILKLDPAFVAPAAAAGTTVAIHSPVHNCSRLHVFQWPFKWPLIL